MYWLITSFADNHDIPPTVCNLCVCVHLSVLVYAHFYCSVSVILYLCSVGCCISILFKYEKKSTAATVDLWPCIELTAKVMFTICFENQHFKVIFYGPLVD